MARVTPLVSLLILAFAVHDSEQTFWPGWPFYPCCSYPYYSYPAYSYPTYQYSYPVQYINPVVSQPATTIIRERAPVIIRESAPVVIREPAPTYEIHDVVPHAHVHSSYYPARTRYMLVPVKKS
ncbi:Spore coat protein T domain protein [Trichostrongylus colubriformis]|uniref:Spore coat protein T domain protein n=1 Tax=Trichostrongylus colubriformis TaxID=6319 RepID=A0AAN8IDL9_TRICO